MKEVTAKNTSEALAADSKMPVPGLTPQQMLAALGDMGCRAQLAHTPEGTPIISSALHGVGFTIRFINAVAGEATKAQSDDAQSDNSYTDISFVYTPRLEGLPASKALPPWIAQVVASWNSERRFAHLSTNIHDNQYYLVLRWDVLVLGVSASYLRSCISLWDQLMQEFFTFLRNRAPKSAIPADSDVVQDTASKTAGATRKPD